MLTLTPIRSGQPLTPEQVAPPPPVPVPALAPDPSACTRAEIEARVAACRPCEHAGPAAATCSTCELRCLHQSARRGEQVLARRASTCPANHWPVLT